MPGHSGEQGRERRFASARGEHDEPSLSAALKTERMHAVDSHAIQRFSERRKDGLPSRFMDSVGLVAEDLKARAYPPFRKKEGAVDVLAISF
jgi:hypothetical protein